MKKISLFILVAMIRQLAISQATDSTKKNSALVISGSVDGYYRYNFNNPFG